MPWPLRSVMLIPPKAWSRWRAPGAVAAVAGGRTRNQDIGYHWRKSRMIGRIQGVLLEMDPPHVLVDVQGVGYEIELPTSALYNLPPKGERIVLHTHYVVREDAHLLYGFLARRDRELFRLLIRVN